MESKRIEVALIDERLETLRIRLGQLGVPLAVEAVPDLKPQLPKKKPSVRRPYGPLHRELQGMANAGEKTSAQGKLLDSGDSAWFRGLSSSPARPTNLRELPGVWSRTHPAGTTRVKEAKPPTGPPLSDGRLGRPRAPSPATQYRQLQIKKKFVADFFPGHDAALVSRLSENRATLEYVSRKGSTMGRMDRGEPKGAPGEDKDDNPPGVDPPPGMDGGLILGAVIEFDKGLLNYWKYFRAKEDIRLRDIASDLGQAQKVDETRVNLTVCLDLQLEGLRGRNPPSGVDLVDVGNGVKPHRGETQITQIPGPPQFKECSLFPKTSSYLQTYADVLLNPQISKEGPRGASTHNAGGGLGNPPVPPHSPLPAVDLVVGSFELDQPLPANPSIEQVILTCPTSMGVAPWPPGQLRVQFLLEHQFTQLENPEAGPVCFEFSGSAFLLRFWNPSEISKLVLSGRRFYTASRASIIGIFVYLRGRDHRLEFFYQHGNPLKDLVASVLVPVHQIYRLEHESNHRFSWETHLAGAEFSAPLRLTLG